MFKNNDNDCPHSCGLLTHGCRLLAAGLLAFGMAACDDDTTLSEPAPEPASTFRVHIGEGNVVQMDMEAPDYYPPMYMAVLVMEDLPADEKIIYMGGVYSTVNTEPDITDATMIADYSDYETIQDWDWEEGPLYWRCMYLFHPLPGTTYYVRGYVQTDKGEYYSNTIEVRSDVALAAAENPEAYEIPVIYHLFPDANGDYPLKEWMVREQLEYANIVFGNRHRIPGQTETGVRFVAATHTPDGQILETPGIVYETEAVEVDYQEPEMNAKYIWDMEHALNVWVCPIRNGDDAVNEYSTLAGFAFFPFFDADEVLEGCSELPQYDLETGIFLNALEISAANSATAFAHEAGHFLGLDHVFAPADDFCADTQWYDFNAHWAQTAGDICVMRTTTAGDTFWSDNIMDYEYGFMTGLTPDQRQRIQYTLRHAYFIPGEAGKEVVAKRSSGQPRRFPANPIR